MGKQQPQYQPSADPKYAPVGSVESEQYARPNEYHRPMELDAQQPTGELPANAKPVQASPGQVHELEGPGWKR